MFSMANEVYCRLCTVFEYLNHDVVFLSSRMHDTVTSGKGGVVKGRERFACLIPPLLLPRWECRPWSTTCQYRSAMETMIELLINSHAGCLGLLAPVPVCVEIFHILCNVRCFENLSSSHSCHFALCPIFAI